MLFKPGSYTKSVTGSHKMLHRALDTVVEQNDIFELEDIEN